MRLKEARAAGAMFYTGKVCAKHPELNGQRRAASGNCHACVVERMKKHRKKNRKHVNATVKAWRDSVKAGEHVPKKYRYAKEKAASAVERAGG